MPNSTWDENSIPWILDKLNQFKVFLGVFFLYFGQNLNKIVYCLVFVPLCPELFALHDMFGGVWIQKDPPFMSNERSVPRTGHHRVNVNSRA